MTEAACTSVLLRAAAIDVCRAHDPGGIGTFSANADYGNATGATFRDKCHLGSASDPHAGEHDDCHVLVGLLMYYVHSPPLVFQLMSVGLYVDPVPARTALAGYKNREEAKVRQNVHDIAAQLRRLVSNVVCRALFPMLLACLGMGCGTCPDADVKQRVDDPTP